MKVVIAALESVASTDSGVIGVPTPPVWLAGLVTVTVLPESVTIACEIRHEDVSFE